MLNRSTRVAHDDAAKLGLLEPARNVAFQDSALAFGVCVRFLNRRNRLAFAGDDQNEAQPAALRIKEKPAQGSMGFVLAHAVKIDAGLDIRPARANLARAIAIE